MNIKKIIKLNNKEIRQIKKLQSKILQREFKIKAKLASMYPSSERLKLEKLFSPYFDHSINFSGFED